MIRYLAANRFPVSMITNGWHLARDALMLVEQGVKSVKLSLDGADAATHDAARGRAGGYDRALAGLQAVLDERRARARHLPRLLVNCVMLPENVRQLPEVVALAGRLGLDGVNFQHLWWHGDGEAPGLDAGAVLAAMRAARARAAAARVKVSFFPDLPEEQVRTYYSRAGTAPGGITSLAQPRRGGTIVRPR